jgi:hypothetical protein
MAILVTYPDAESRSSPRAASSTSRRVERDVAVPEYQQPLPSGWQGNRK